MEIKKTIKVYKNFILLKPVIDFSNYSKAKIFIYNFLNKYEKVKDIFIENIPYCFLPDAWDHIIYAPSEVTRKIDICSKCRLNSICQGVESGSFFDKNRKELSPVLSIPNEVVIELTLRCNLMCKMCKFKENLYVELSTNKMFKIIDEISEFGVRNIRFTGGEPLLREDLFKILEYAKLKGFYVILNTNASTNLSFNLKYCVDNVLVSLQGFDPDSDYKITGGKSFKLKLKNIRKLRKDIKVLRIGTVITKDVINNFDKFYDLIKSFSPDIWELYRPMMDKKFLNDKELFNIQPSDVEILLQKIDKVRNLLIYIANPLPFCRFARKYYKYFLGARFDDGHTRIVYDSSGYYKPSYYINYNLGTNIESAWNNDFLIRKINDFKYLSEKCLKCNYLLKCLGGSRYLAKLYKNSYTEMDPWF